MWYPFARYDVPFQRLGIFKCLGAPQIFFENHILGLKIGILFSICTRLIYVLQFDLYLHMTGLSLSLGMPFSPAIGCFIERNIAIIAAGGRSHNLIIKIGDRFPRASRSSFWQFCHDGLRYAKHQLTKILECQDIENAKALKGNIVASEGILYQGAKIYK